MASMLDIPTDPKKIRARIRSYERKLQQELAEHGNGYGDGAGKRHFVGPLYMAMGDVEGALRSFRWFEATWPDDGGDSWQILCWSLALYRSGDRDAATKKLRQAMLMNRYVLPTLLGRKFEVSDQRDDDNFDGDYFDLCNNTPEAFFALWTEKEKAWAAELYDGALKPDRERHDDIEQRLKTEPRGPERTRLVNESFKMTFGRELEL